MRATIQGVPIMCGVALVLGSLATSISPAQTRWEPLASCQGEIESPCNPVLSGPANGEGSWDAVATGSGISVVFDEREGGFLMWYTGSEANSQIRRIGLARSADGKTWEKEASNPVLDIGPQGSWEERGVDAPFVLRSGDLFKMWYGGIDDGRRVRIGHATSRDGVRWEKYPENPVLEGDTGAWDAIEVHNHAVVVDESAPVLRFRMWYSGNATQSAVEVFPRSRIGLAESPDGVHWRKRPEPVLAPGTEGPEAWERSGVRVGTVLEDGGLYDMWYSGTSNNVDSQIGHATSLDGIVWQRHEANPVLTLSAAPDWGIGSIDMPCVIREGRKLRVWYWGTNGRGGASIFDSGVGHAEAPLDLLFKRADVDGNGRVDLTDPVRLLEHLFVGTGEPGCLDAADADDSGNLDLSDAVFSLAWLFLGGGPPPPPGPEACGPDPTPSSLSFDGCADDPEEGCRREL